MLKFKYTHVDCGYLPLVRYHTQAAAVSLALMYTTETFFLFFLSTFRGFSAYFWKACYSFVQTFMKADVGGRLYDSKAALC